MSDPVIGRVLAPAPEPEDPQSTFFMSMRLSSSCCHRSLDRICTVGKPDTYRCRGCRKLTTPREL